MEVRRMRLATLGALVWCVLAVSASGAAPDAELIAPIRRFVDSFNKGDMVAAEAAHAPGDVSILDEVSPYLWRGPQAFKAWSTDLSSDARERGITEQVVELSDPTREETSGDHAYVVVPAVYTFKERGKAMREQAQFVFALQKGATGWLIHGWAWTGPKASRAEDRVIED
jgi:hypothetical protein